MLQDPYRLSIAPMMDWTDRHCRVFHRLLSRRARLYTEMLTTGAIIATKVCGTLTKIRRLSVCAIRKRGWLLEPLPAPISRRREQEIRAGRDSRNFECTARIRLREVIGLCEVAAFRSQHDLRAAG